jgi:cytochrome bd ubiquinol oxidase subunit I
VVHPPVSWNSDGTLKVDDTGHVAYDESLGLRTVNAVSPVITAKQTLGSIIMFGLIYSLLFVVWVVVLNHKIQVGPEAPGDHRVVMGPHTYLDTAARRQDHSGSLTGLQRETESRDES